MDISEVHDGSKGASPNADNKSSFPRTQRHKVVKKLSRTGSQGEISRSSNLHGAEVVIDLRSSRKGPRKSRKAKTRGSAPAKNEEQSNVNRFKRDEKTKRGKETNKSGFNQKSLRKSRIRKGEYVKGDDQCPTLPYITFKKAEISLSACTSNKSNSLHSLLVKLETEYPLTVKEYPERAVDTTVYAKAKLYLQALIANLRFIDVSNPQELFYACRVIYWNTIWLYQYCTDQIALSINLSDSFYPFLHTLLRYNQDIEFQQVTGRVSFKSCRLLSCLIDWGVKLARYEKIRRINANPVPLIESRFEILSKEINKHYEMNKSTAQICDARNEVQKELESQVKSILKGGHLRRFGSAANGLGSRRSADLDLSLSGYEESDVERIAKEHNLLEPGLSVVKKVGLNDPVHSVNTPGSNGNEFSELILDFSAKLKHAKGTSRKEPGIEQIIVRILGKLLTYPFEVTEVVDKARVPIVRLIHLPTEIQCEICVDNKLGIYNTELLKTYAKYDWRVKPLIFAVKDWAKARNICDASKGSISSYSWVLLVIFFLQQSRSEWLRDRLKSCEGLLEVELGPGKLRPVLPCLQKLKPNTPQVIVKQNYRGEENLRFDVTFRQDIYALKRTTANLGDRFEKSSVGSLLVHFFYYYAYVVNFERFIISIKTGSLLKKQLHEHLSKGNGLSIEDPFEPQHDLGAKLRGYLANRIFVTELERAYELCANAEGSVLSDLMKPQELPEELGSKERRCRSCVEIGHASTDCPLNNLLTATGCLFCGEQNHKTKACRKTVKDIFPNLIRTEPENFGGCAQQFDYESVVINKKHKFKNEKKKQIKRICKDWLKDGTCSYGESCKFQHIPNT